MLMNDLLRKITHGKNILDLKSKAAAVAFLNQSRMAVNTLLRINGITAVSVNSSSVIILQLPDTEKIPDILLGTL